MTALDTKFVTQAATAPVEVEHGSRTARFAATTAATGEGAAQINAELEVFLDGELVGYITPFADNERGAVPVDQFGESLPTTFHTIEGALEHLAPGAADGLATPALQQ
jgi:hypothetical protein